MGLEILHYYAGGIGTLIPPAFSLDFHPCVAKLGGWVPWRREAEEPDQGFVRCLARGEGEICTYSIWLIKMWFSSSYNQCVLYIESFFMIIFLC